MHFKLSFLSFKKNFHFYISKFRIDYNEIRCVHLDKMLYLALPGRRESSFKLSLQRLQFFDTHLSKIFPKQIPFYFKDSIYFLIAETS